MQNSCNAGMSLTEATSTQVPCSCCTCSGCLLRAVSRPTCDVSCDEVLCICSFVPSGTCARCNAARCMQTALTWSHVCKPQEWRAMRSIANANNEITHKPAKEHKPLILFIDGQTHERRNFPSAKDLLPELRKKFPEAEIRYEQISKLPGAPPPHACPSLWTAMRRCAACS